MTTFNFYASNFPEYYWQKPHYNLGNKLVHSDAYKAMNPLRQHYDYNPNDYSQMPYFLGHIPQLNWIYGNLDYSFHKYHRHYQAHDDWYPDRKGKTLGHKNGGFCDPTLRLSKYMTLQPVFIPRGCQREIKRYQVCASEKSDQACFQQKLGIMEVCPDHILEGLREKKKWFARAELIDNQTYKRAMTVSDYNKDRSVSDLKLKTWEDGISANLRPDSYWVDDRYNPRSYPHPHRYDNINFPNQEYKDILGGNWGESERQEMERHQLPLFGGKSKAMQEHLEKQKAQSTSLKDAVKEVKEHNSHAKED